MQGLPHLQHQRRVEDILTCCPQMNRSRGSFAPRHHRCSKLADKRDGDVSGFLRLAAAERPCRQNQLPATAPAPLRNPPPLARCLRARSSSAHSKRVMARNCPAGENTRVISGVEKRNEFIPSVIMRTDPALYHAKKTVSPVPCNITSHLYKFA